MRVLLVLFASSFATVAFAQGADGLGSPRAPTEAASTQTPSQTPSTEPTSENGEATPNESAESTAEPALGASPPATPAPAGAPVVPPGYETGTPAPYAPAPGAAPGAYPAPGPYPVAGAYPMPTPPPRLTRVRFREGMEIPPHGRLIERRLNFLLWPGLAVFAVSYALGTLLIIDSDEALAAIPFLGPLLWQARDGTSADLEYTIPSALFQVVGVIAFALGVKKRRYLEVWRVGNEPVPGPVASRPRREIAVLPNLHRHGGGISLMVR